MTDRVGMANMNLSSMWPMGNSNARLAGLTDDQLKQVSANTGISFQMLKGQQMAEMASAGGSGGFGGNEAVVPTVEVDLVQDAKNPRKARRKNIKKLRKALKPPSYLLGLWRIYRYNGTFECACCGVDVRRFLEGDNDYAQIVDYDVGLSLADLYWFDEETGNSVIPHARTRGDHGDEMNSTLCPAHLHIHHTLRKLVQEDQLEGDGLRPVSKGTKFLKVPGMSALTGGLMGSGSKNRATTDSLIKYEPFFKMLRQDAEHKKGITLTQYPNPITGVSDLVTVTFDLRALQIEDAMIQRQTMGLASSNVPQAVNQMPPVPQAPPNPQTTNTEVTGQ